MAAAIFAVAVAAANTALAATDMYRLYNPYTGEHFYTKDTVEKVATVAAGWTYEGIGWTAPSSGETVYRLYNPYAGDHHYTLDRHELVNLIDHGWEYEGIGWYSDESESVPLYRSYNPYATTGTHNYTQDVIEYNFLKSLGWQSEGIAWYGINPTK